MVKLIKNEPEIDGSSVFGAIGDVASAFAPDGYKLGAKVAGHVFGHVVKSAFSTGREATKQMDCPETKEVRQPTGFERSTTHRTRRLQKICKLGNRLGNSAVKNFLQAMAQERVVKCCWQYQMVIPTNRRCSVAQVHRHMAGLTGTTTATFKTNLPRLNSPNNGALLAKFASGDQSVTVTSNLGWMEQIYSPYNAAFYEQIAYGMGATGIGSILGNPGSAGPIVTKDLTIGSDTINNVLRIGDGLNTNVAPHSDVNSPFYTIPALDSSNELTTQNTSKKIFQRHTAGGVDVNVMNMSEYPMNVDIVVFKCKSTASGDDDAVPPSSTQNIATASDTSEAGALYLSQRYGDANQSAYQIGDMYNPVANILAGNVQKFWNWKGYLEQATAKAGGNTELPGGEVNIAGFNFTTNTNPLADPNWKFLANYGTSSRLLGEANGVTNDLYGSTENYKEVDRIRVNIPVSGSYIHKMKFGGMQYDVVDRINRSRNQNTQYMQIAGQTTVPTYRITDIRGETYVVFVSAAGAQQPGSGSGELGLMTPGGNLAVRVEEYEIIQPFYADIEKQKPVYTKGSLKPNTNLSPLNIVPITQWVKDI